jgi:hypothetical protein
MPWATAIGIICLVYWGFDVAPAVSAPAGAAGRRPGAARLRTGGGAFDQTLPVHSMRRSGPPAPQPSQRCWPGAAAMSTALRGGVRR